MLCILKKFDEITYARMLLNNRGLNVLPTRFGNFLRSLHLLKVLAVGEVNKGWDVLKTIDFIDSTLEKDAAVLDIGAFSSEILPLLARLGHTNLVGIDLNPCLMDMPSAGIIRYDVGNFLATSYPDGYFSVISAISVIEHGYDGQKLFEEIARLLAPGGFFVASFDYWPQKIDSSDVSPFGLSWTIFSLDQVNEMIDQAAIYDLEPIDSLDYTAQDRTINWQDKKYTFAWMVLRKKSL